MDFDALVRKSRTVRRFKQSETVPMAVLADLADLARHCPSAGNLQPLKFVLCNAPDMNEEIFKTLGWAAYLPRWAGPGQGERPSAYVVVLCDRSVAESPSCDHGIVAQTIMLGARSRGLGGCIMGSVNRDSLGPLLGLPEGLDILLVLALGVPAEDVVVDDLKPVPYGHKYWRDEAGVHHVPKRVLDELVLARIGE